MVIAATVDAQDIISTSTDLQVRCHINLLQADNLFSDDCVHFSDDEKQAILYHCTTHFPNEPRGYANCGLLFVLQHDCPNNVIV
jgi:hypothetical protein